MALNTAAYKSDTSGSSFVVESSAWEIPLTLEVSLEQTAPPDACTSQTSAVSWAHSRVYEKGALTGWILCLSSNSPYNSRR